MQEKKNSKMRLKKKETLRRLEKQQQHNAT